MQDRTVAKSVSH